MKGLNKPLDRHRRLSLCPSRLSLYVIAHCRFSLYFHLKQLVTSAGVREEDYVEGQSDISYILSIDGRAFLELS